MTDYFNLDAARARYKSEPDEVLIRVAFATDSTYRPEAIELARQELAARGIDEQQHPLVLKTREVVDTEVKQKTLNTDAPLATGYKIICFIFADVIGIIIALTHYAYGKTRAATEAWKWMGFGWIARVVLVIGLFLVMSR